MNDAVSHISSSETQTYGGCWCWNILSLTWGLTDCRFRCVSFALWSSKSENVLLYFRLFINPLGEVVLWRAAHETIMARVISSHRESFNLTANKSHLENLTVVSRGSLDRHVFVSFRTNLQPCSDLAPYLTPRPGKEPLSLWWFLHQTPNHPTTLHSIEGLIV